MARFAYAGAPCAGPFRAGIAAAALVVAALAGSSACSDVAKEAAGATVGASSSPPAGASASMSASAGASPSAQAGAPSSAQAAPSAQAGAPAASIPARAPIIAGTPSPAAAALASEPPRPPDGKGAGLDGSVDEALDGAWIVRLAAAPIVEVSPNRGGASVSMRVRFADGQKAALKPEQRAHPSDPRAEIAAYHVDRLVGFARTAAVAGRVLPAAELRAALVAGGAPAAFLGRFDAEVVVRDGQVGAAMIAWHAAPLVEEEAEPPWAAALAGDGPAPEGSATKLGERADLVVFDFLIDNPDRFSGGNILRLGERGPLVFLDQGAAFGKNRLAQKKTTRDRLEKVCRFRPATLAALRRASRAPLSALLEKSLARDALAPVLSSAQLSGVDERLAALLEHARGCSERSGQPSLSPSAQAAPR